MKVGRLYEDSERDQSALKMNHLQAVCVKPVVRGKKNTWRGEGDETSFGLI